MASADALDGLGGSRPSNKLSFLDLPREVQRAIFSHCSSRDLICLSLVSKHFRELAAAQLYRNFHIIFSVDDDDPASDDGMLSDFPVDGGLAGGLDTFVTSDYDYARHLRDLSFDTLHAGNGAEAAYKPYLYSVSCGKFMNTLMLLTLRKAIFLESFKWNIRVELSRPVYKALHNIGTLRHFHIRLQAGVSLFEPPVPLPLSSMSSSSSASSSSTHLPGPPLPPPLPPTFAIPVMPVIPTPPSVFYGGPPNPPISHSLPKPLPRTRTSKKTVLLNEPPTLSGFKNLKSLAVLDIDNLDVVTELKICVRNSSATLTNLKLSFSDSLGLLARKPSPDVDSEDSDQEDEFNVGPTHSPGSGYDEAAGPARAFRAQEEKKSQETVLGRIFDVDPYIVKKPEKDSRQTAKESKDKPPADPKQQFINALKTVSNRLMQHLNGTSDISAAQQDMLDMVVNAAKKYLDSGDATSGQDRDEEKEDRVAAEASNAQSTSKGEDKETASEQPNPSGSSLFTNKTLKAKDAHQDANPEDIDIEEPEEQLAIELQDTISTAPTNESDSPAVPGAAAAQSSSSPAETASADASSPQTGVEKVMSNLAIQKVNFRTLTEKLGILEDMASRLNKELQQLRNADGSYDREELADAEKMLKVCTLDMQRIQQEVNTVKAEIDDLQKQIPPSAAAAATDGSEQTRRVNEYLRSTRGLALETLAIYLIPVKASVLSRAVDLRVLRRITLLNVGSQAPIWAHFLKENKEAPLPLREIFTDNVSAAFLTFVSQLEELDDLFILERDHKYKPESFAPRTTITMDHIRRLVLKKHLRTLKRLMIKNMANMSWDLDEKTTQLVCRRGKQLVELACSMGIKAIHTFIQNMSGLVNLHALHIIQLRNDDTCVWVMRETKKFLVDTLAHQPHMKLEWISIDDDDCADRIVRSSKARKKDKSKKAKGKQKATTAAAVNPGLLGNDMFTILLPSALDGWDAGNSSTDDEHGDDADDEVGTVVSLSGIRFYKINSVRIFEKEVVVGRV